MPSLQSLLFLSILAGFLILTSTEAAVSYLGHVCPNTTTFIPDDPFIPDPNSFQYNVKNLLSTLSSNANRDTGFYNNTVGESSTEKAYGLFLCRGDIVGTNVCKDCVATATVDAVQRCPIEKEVLIWYEECMVRYSNQSFFFNLSAKSPFNFSWEWAERVTDPTRFNLVLARSMDKLANDAAYHRHKFATNEANFNGSMSVYSLGQCTQDLSAADCLGCLQRAIAQLSICCGGSKGAQILYPSCNVWYDVYRFWHNSTAAHAPAPAALPPPLPISVARHKGAGRTKFVSYIIIGATSFVLVSVCVVLGYCFLARKVRNKKYNAALQHQNAGKDIKTVVSLHFDLGTIETATNKFSEDNKLGEGGFGAVFKGTLGNGQVIAVKRLSKSSKQGVQEFKNEVALVAKLQHRNLVRLLGFCLQGEETILVYEYVPNKSLDYFLFEPTKRVQLDWLRCCMIVGGIARGILYLHEDSRLRVIHRDLKASNILLDGDMNPKISDFGMARMFGVDDQIQGNTKRIVGTYGYMAPEYAMKGVYSVKSDVFSFGILLLEIITGRKNFLGFHFTNCSPTLLAYAWQLWNEGNVLELIDPLLKDSCSPNEFLRYIHIGLLCVQEDANNRPTMSSVVLMLKIETIELSKPERPAFIFTGRSCTTYHHDDQIGAHGGSANGMTISDFGPR